MAHKMALSVVVHLVVEALVCFCFSFGSSALSLVAEKPKSEYVLQMSPSVRTRSMAAPCEPKVLSLPENFQCLEAVPS